MARPPIVASLSFRLRSETADLHLEIEKKLNLPGSITTVGQYTRCLGRFYQLYRPLERQLARFEDWPQVGIDFTQRTQTEKLAMDLKALGVSCTELEDAPEAALPSLPDFSHALGALYVLEGSRLGARFILQSLSEKLGNAIAPANCFFLGRGAETGSRWKGFQFALDAYGVERAEKISSVVLGAQATFQHLGIGWELERNNSNPDFWRNYGLVELRS